MVPGDGSFALSEVEELSNQPTKGTNSGEEERGSKMNLIRSQELEPLSRYNGMVKH